MIDLPIQYTQNSHDTVCWNKHWKWTPKHVALARNCHDKVRVFISYQFYHKICAGEQ
jgi:hypothetical protein